MDRELLFIFRVLVTLDLNLVYMMLVKGHEILTLDKAFRHRLHMDNKL